MAKSTIDAPALQKALALVVEDNRDHRAAVERVLQTCKHVRFVPAVYDGDFKDKDVLQWVKKQLDENGSDSPACLFLDLSWTYDTQEDYIRLLLCPEPVTIRLNSDMLTGGLRLIQSLGDDYPELTIVAISTFGAQGIKGLARHLGAHHTIQKYPKLGKLTDKGESTSVESRQDRYATDLATIVSNVFQEALKLKAFQFEASGITSLNFDDSLMSQVAEFDLLKAMLHHQGSDGKQLPLDEIALACDLASFWTWLFDQPDLQKQKRLENQLVKAAKENADDIFIGNAPSIHKLRERATRCAKSKLPVLICGETGVGKETLAELIWKFSDRAKIPIRIYNCAHGDQLVESSLFGHEKGAFTNATSDREGIIERSHGGILFLDEIGDMPLDVQAKVLRVIETGEYERVGGSKVKKANVRIIAGTNVDLNKAMKEGRFRTDLYYRLAGYRFDIPPLRDRREDIDLLLDGFLRKYNSPIVLSDDEKKTLRNIDWPGNVRQLRNFVLRLIDLGPGKTVTHNKVTEILTEMLNAEPNPSPGQSIDLSAQTSLRVDEHLDALKQEALKRTNGDKTKAARMMGRNRTTLYKKSGKDKRSDD